MKQNEYLKTVVVYGKMVNVGIDDYGQQYFIEYVNDDGELIEVGCGSYNFGYLEVAKDAIDHRRFMIELWGEEEYTRVEQARTERMAKQWNKEMRELVCRK